MSHEAGSATAGEARGTSLVLYRESVPPDEVLDRCPRKLDFVMLNRQTWEIVPARCKANSCPFCGPMNARLVAGAIGLGKPQRMVTLTDVGDDWVTVRRRVRQFTHETRAAGYRWDWAWHIEVNPKGTGHHLHGWQRGDFVPQPVLSRVADGVGMGAVTDIRRVRARAHGYGLKSIPYGLKATEAAESMKLYLTANGGRLCHTSRGYWRDEHGHAVGQREAMTAWVRVRNDGGEGHHEESSESESPWQIVRKSQINRACLV